MTISNNFIWKTTGILFIAFGFRVSSGQVTCYLGSTNKTHDWSQQQQPCVREHTTSNTRDALNLSYSPAEGGNSTSGAIKFCLVTVSETTLPKLFEYGCDHDSICSIEGVQRQFNNSGKPRTVFCCQSNLCNSLENATEAIGQAVNNSCYLKPDVEALCTGSHCTNRTVFTQNGTVIQHEYNCGNETVDTKDECHKVSSKDGYVQICTCSGKNCNRPAENVAFASSSVTALPQIDMTNPFYAIRRTEHNWTFIGTVTATALLLLVFLILVSIGIKKFREHRAQHLTYTYTQLTAALAEERDTDDEDMLTG